MEENRYKVVVTPFAEKSIRKIAEYIAYHLIEPQTAVRLMQTLREEILGLSFMPERVHLTPEEPWRGYGVRRLTVKNYYVYFWVDAQSAKVYVTDVVCTRQNQQWTLERMPMK